MAIPKVLRCDYGCMLTNSAARVQYVFWDNAARVRIIRRLLRKDSGEDRRTGGHSCQQPDPVVRQCQTVDHCSAHAVCFHVSEDVDE